MMQWSVLLAKKFCFMEMDSNTSGDWRPNQLSIWYSREASGFNSNFNTLLSASVLIATHQQESKQGSPGEIQPEWQRVEWGQVDTHLFLLPGIILANSQPPPYTHFNSRIDQWERRLFAPLWKTPEKPLRSWGKQWSWWWLKIMSNTLPSHF